VNKITFAESNEVVIGSDMQIGPDMEVVDGVSSTITTRGEVNFMKSFSLYVTLYRDKKDVVLVSFGRRIFSLFIFLKLKLLGKVEETVYQNQITERLQLQTIRIHPIRSGSVHIDEQSTQYLCGSK
jgi:hypothetical protein